jgi:hypothetical protein
VVSLLPRLKRRQRALVIGHFGLFGCPAQNLTELAEYAAISRERARQIVLTALRKLRWWARLADVLPATMCSPSFARSPSGREEISLPPGSAHRWPGGRDAGCSWQKFGKSRGVAENENAAVTAA